MELKDIVDVHKDKRAFIAALGPSLNEVLSDFEEMSNDETNNDIFISCNLYQKMCDIQTDYFVVTNNQKIMSLKQGHTTYNKSNSTLIFADRINGFSIKEAQELLTCKWIAIHDQPNNERSIQDLFEEYTTGDEYGAVSTVLLHMVAVAVIAGCKEIYIAGADLDYSKGYAKEGFHETGVRLGRMYMQARSREESVQQIKKMKDSASKVGVNIYCLNKTSPLCQVLDHREFKTLTDDTD